MPSVSTKTKILDSAEQLFAQQGFGETSLRAITAAAGVNLAAVNYHFGSKEALAGAVVGRLMAPINEERLRLLDELEAGETEPLLENIVRAFVGPAVRFSQRQGNATHIQLFGHVMTGPPIIRQAVIQNFEIIPRRFVAAMSKAAPFLSLQEMIIRWRFFVASFTATMMPMPMIQEHAKLLKGKDHDVVEHFVTYAVGGLMAPPHIATKTGTKG